MTNVESGLLFMSVWIIMNDMLKKSQRTESFYWEKI